jgi:hypothetical protein
MVTFDHPRLAGASLNALLSSMPLCGQTPPELSCRERDRGEKGKRTMDAKEYRAFAEQCIALANDAPDAIGPV